MKLGDFQVKPLDFSRHALISQVATRLWRAEDKALCIRCRPWDCRVLLKEGQGPQPHSQASCDLQNWTVASGRPYGGAAPPRKGHSPPALPTSCPVFDARWTCRPSSGLQEYAKDDIHNLPQGAVLSSFSLLSLLHHTDSTALHCAQRVPRCLMGKVLPDRILSLDHLLSPLTQSQVIISGDE